MSDNTPADSAASDGSIPNSDIVSLPGSHKDVQEGVTPLTEPEQLVQLNNFFEDNYPEVFRSLTTDEGAEYRDRGEAVPAALVDETERMWARLPDLLSHSSLLVLGAGLDHQMPHVASLRSGPETEVLDAEAALPEGISATVLTPSHPNGAWAISCHGGPGWFGDGASHDQFWLPLFAAIAEESGVTIVDLTYPLPGYGSWEATQEAVAEAFDAVRENAPEGASVGTVTFGSGFLATAGVRHPDFVVAMTPRITEDLQVDTGAAPVLVSLAARDSRGTSEEQVREFFDRVGTGSASGSADSAVSYRTYESEHIIAAPTVWRHRVADVAQWLAEITGDHHG
ncbi:alpha/beta hydrolase [Corynebacterium falsenii]|uniref:alpha/beta hydrolase n=1 Tax=Corynebacterium falsenii TaxID=108486 RepID=UPI003FD60274